MAYVNSLAVFISYALSTEPGSTERHESLITLASIRRKNPDDLVLGLVCDLLAEKRVYGDVTFMGEHKELLEKATFTIVDPGEVVPYLTAAPARRGNASYFDSFVYEGEALCFSLGAKVLVD